MSGIGRSVRNDGIVRQKLTLSFRTVLLAVAFLVMSVLVDALYLWLDPRIKYQ